MRRNDEYKDDLAQVISLDGDKSRAEVRMIPRLRIFLTRGGDEEGNSKVRPPAKLFNADEVRARGGRSAE